MENTYKVMGRRHTSFLKCFFFFIYSIADGLEAIRAYCFPIDIICLKVFDIGWIRKIALSTNIA